MPNGLQSRTPENPVVLADIIRPEAADFDTMRRTYPFIASLKVLLGATPNACRFMTPCPPVLHSYFVLVPNLFNIPTSVFGLGTVSMRTKALTMYTSSQTAGCNYCSLHICTMALRRGLPEQALTGTGLSPKESVAAKLGVALGSTPCMMDRAVYQELTDVFNPADVEWVILAACMMGWLNRFMHVVGVDMEEALVLEVGPMLREQGWSTGDHAISPPLDRLQELEANPLRGDTVGSALQMLSSFPSAFMYDVRATYGVPGSWPASGVYLHSIVGHDFPVLGKIQYHSCARKAITSSLREMLMSESCGLSRKTKYLVGVAFSIIAENQELQEYMQNLLSHDSLSDPGSPPDTVLATVAQVSQKSGLGVSCDEAWVTWVTRVLETECELDPRDSAVIALGIASTTAPPRVTPAVLALSRDRLTPKCIVEVAGWLSMLTLLNRMICYFTVMEEN